MSFSVDYQFVQGEPAASEYFLVIDRAAGPPATEVVRLQRQGALPVFLPGWKPEEGPFKAHLEGQNGQRISDTVSLRNGG